MAIRHFCFQSFTTEYLAGVTAVTEFWHDNTLQRVELTNPSSTSSTAVRQAHFVGERELMDFYCLLRQVRRQSVIRQATSTFAVTIKVQ